ncbi:hypothetical protein ACJ73_05984 [Blastomyces percursus]|uniref:Uncharacterized protein n=1 Tax=Blastomyces percursus TaxID=1658174 RepID=A0A1J9Q269_9EURO|nr:hypothetical protein ACJ73_05984 [Blastomyces percursus]
MTDPAIQLAETIQTVSINPHPSAAHDINPSTATSQKEPVAVGTHHHRSPSYATSISTDIVDPSRSIRPLQRAPLPPLPDLRFEQSYLASLKGAETWQRVAWITLRDQNDDSIRLLMLSLPQKNRSSSPCCKGHYGHSPSLAGDIGIAEPSSPAKRWEPGSAGGGGKSTTGRYLNHE